MKFSIIMPAHNVQDYIDWSMQSVLNQSFKDFELIIIDDKSTDLTVAKVQSYQDPRIILLRTQGEKPGGPGAARNRGLEAARGEYILFLDSDDCYVNNDCLKFLDSKCTGEDMIFYDFIFGRFGKFGMTWENRFYHCAVWFKAWKRSFIGDTRFPELMIAEDLEFQSRMLAKNPTQVVYSEPIVFYNYPRQGSLTSGF